MNTIGSTTGGLGLLMLLAFSACEAPEELGSAPDGVSPVLTESQAQDVNLYTVYEARDHNYNVDTVLWIDDDGGGPGFFWALHGALQNGDGYYVGLQENDVRGKQAIFSVWNAVDAECSSAGYEVSYDNEGSGRSCRLDFTYRENTRYRLRMWALGDRWWGGWVINEDTGVEFYVGKIRARAGAGDIGPSVTGFTEYFGEAVPCRFLPHAAARWSGISTDGRSHLATRVNQHVGVGCQSVNSATDVGLISGYHEMGRD